MAPAYSQFGNKSVFFVAIFVLLCYMALLRNVILPIRRVSFQTPFLPKTYQLRTSSSARVTLLHNDSYYSYFSKQNITTNTTNIIMIISHKTLQKQNAETSNAIIEHYKDSAAFAYLSKHEGDSTIQRDNEDGVKLEKGIEFAKSKGVIDPDYVPEPYLELDVLGKTPETVAGTILDKIKQGSGDSNSGSVIVLCGLSGTGKGTTVTKLRQKLEQEEGKKVVTWSNGNIFRSVTLVSTGRKK
jgi:flagellar biosynthesis GTPase FlhF